MTLVEILIMSVGLAMDAMAVCLGIAAAGLSAGGRARFRLAFHFGLFQFLMPVIGWFAGTSIERFIAVFDHWVAFALLSFVGVRMIRAGLREEGESYATDPSRGITLVMLSVAVSIDALAVGLSLAMVHISIWYPGVIVGVVTGALSMLGLLLGDRIGTRFGHRMEIAGGVILLLIGIRIVVSHVLF